MFEKNKNLIIGLIVPFLLTSCYTYKDKALLQERSDIPVYDSVPYHEYHIRPNDEIIYRVISTAKKSVFQSNNSSSETSMTNVITYRVYEDGTIDIPFVKGIEISGMTIADAEKEVQRRVREIEPDATVRLTLANKTFSMIGDIGEGNYFIYKEKMTIFQALAQSGLVPATGDKKHIKILRQTENGGQKILEFDIRSKSIINSEYYYVYPNDVIYVQRDKGSFYKVSTYTSVIGLITSTFNFMATIFLFK
jgi:polysaccharide export outer membrane protein